MIGNMTTLSKAGAAGSIGFESQVWRGLDAVKCLVL
jgi:hypothetical protein